MPGSNMAVLRAKTDILRRSAVGAMYTRRGATPGRPSCPSSVSCGTVQYEHGSFYDGTRRTLALNTARLEVTPRISIEPRMSVNRVRMPYGNFTATVLRARGTFTVTPRMFVSGIAQYNSSATSFGSNLRFRWEYRPGSELFVVYTDDYDTNARAGVDTLRNRALVVKVNRLFRP